MKLSAFAVRCSWSTLQAVFILILLPIIAVAGIAVTLDHLTSVRG